MGKKKIVAIIGGPKKTGDTIGQVRIFEELLNEKETVDFEYLYPTDYELKDCIGCGLCFDKNKCPLKDDKDIILEKINQSDGVVWVSPVYSMHISNTLKKLIDRFAYLYHRPPFFHKKAVVIVVKGNLFREPLQYLKNNLASWGFDCVGTLGMPAIIQMPDKMKKKKIVKVKKLAERFIKQIKNDKLPSPGIKSLLTFKMWKLRAKLMDESNADYLYFKENSLFNKDYFCNVRINLFNRIATAAIFPLLVFWMKREFGDLKKL